MARDIMADIMLDTIRKYLGDNNTRAAVKTRGMVERINGLEAETQKLTDEQLKAKTAEFKERYKKGESLDQLLPEAFAVVREASVRETGLRHYDVQLTGGILLHQGMIAEMKTGEGKTLVATLPTYLNALTGKGVHVVTVNDYLSRRDAVWVGQIYARLGMSVGVINTNNVSYVYDPTVRVQENDEGETLDEVRDEVAEYKVVYDFLKPCERKEAYQRDITYGVNSEFGFDYLRDNLEFKPDNVRQGEPVFAIIDEIDSILIDEARTPLIISAPARQSEDLYSLFANVARGLTEGEHYTIDEKYKQIALTDAGIEKAEEILKIDNIYTQKGVKYVHHLETAVRAKALYSNDKEYVVRDGQVIIVDESTGRMQPGRRWAEGLHQAIEAKEGMVVQQEAQTVASVTYQNYFRMYEKLCGMTGTAETSAEEFFKVYSLDVAVVPTNVPVQRKDLNDLIFGTEQGKFTAIARKVRELQERGQPVLIGTVSIETSEMLSQFLDKQGIRHQVLNAKNHEQEGEIVADAGRKGAVTVATNMAGRGVDIKLGGIDATKEQRKEVLDLGGLYVIGTERHDARRIDNQLRGRSGRQGDPGETQFYVSMEDTMMRVFANDMVKGMMTKLGLEPDQPIEHRMISRSLETAQTRIEGMNFDSRKHVLQFDDVLNTQRKAVYGMRRTVLLGDDDAVKELLEKVAVSGNDQEDEQFGMGMQARIEKLGESKYLELFRKVYLETINTYWMDHLDMMDFLRSSVNLRAYGQRDPLVEYKKEGLMFFRQLLVDIDAQTRDIMNRLDVDAIQELERRAAEKQAEIDKVVEASGVTAESAAQKIEEKKEKKQAVMSGFGVSRGGKKRK